MFPSPVGVFFLFIYTGGGIRSKMVAFSSPVGVFFLFIDFIFHHKELLASFHPLSGFSSYLSYPLEATIQATSKGGLHVKKIITSF